MNFFSRSLGLRPIRVSTLPWNIARYGTHQRFGKVPGVSFTVVATLGLGLSTILTRGQTYCDR